MESEDFFRKAPGKQEEAAPEAGEGMLGKADIEVGGGDRLCHKVMEQVQPDRDREPVEAQEAPEVEGKDGCEAANPEQDREENASVRPVEQPFHMNGAFRVRAIRARIAEQT